MLTRLKVSGFKNLLDVDVRFGPFTAIAGVNGVGKSNLFDAIHFLSLLADRPLIDAALAVREVRDERSRTADIRSLFYRIGDAYADEMVIEAEMIVPAMGDDDLGQKAHASITFLRYSLELAYRQDPARPLPGTLEIQKEELTHITQGDAPANLPFLVDPTSGRPRYAQWRRSAIHGRRTAPHFISTEGEPPSRIIKLHQDGGGGRPLGRLAANLPRTVLSVVNAAESPTALLARREMQSWRLLQLEPSALRQPDEVSAPPRMGSDGSHLAATLYHLARQPQSWGDDTPGHPVTEALYGRVANRLAELISGVKSVWVDRDEKRELLTMFLRDLYDTDHPARSLSDGTLRFLALAVIELDPSFQGLLCLEEPENGIHPERIPAMLRLLQDIATDLDAPIGDDNPLRQVIVNTHSPAVVAQVPDDALLVAESRELVEDGRRLTHAVFSCLPDTWRARTDGTHIVPRGKLLSYLNPVRAREIEDGEQPSSSRQSYRRSRRVSDREDLQLLLFPPPAR